MSLAELKALSLEDLAIVRRSLEAIHRGRAMFVCIVRMPPHLPNVPPTAR